MSLVTGGAVGSPKVRFDVAAGVEQVVYHNTRLDTVVGRLGSIRDRLVGPVPQPATGEEDAGSGLRERFERSLRGQGGLIAQAEEFLCDIEGALGFDQNPDPPTAALRR